MTSEYPSTIVATPGNYKAVIRIQGDICFADGRRALIGKLLLGGAIAVITVIARASPIASATVGNPTTITSTGHGLLSSDSIVISGVTGGTPSINGTYPVTKLTDRFSKDSALMHRLLCLVPRRWWWPGGCAAAGWSPH